MIQKVKAYLKDNKAELFIVLLLFLLAFGIRAHLMVYQLMFEFDSYFHARIGEYILQTMTMPKVDPLAYYQVAGGAALPVAGSFFWTVTTTIFKIVTLGAPYNKQAWIAAVKFFPAFFGAIISIAMYYLGKSMYGRRAGVVMAFFAAVVPAFVYRTMAGFFEDDSLGFFWLVMGLLFAVRAVKEAKLDRDSLINSMLAAFFFSVMAIAWGAFLLVPVILIGFIVVTAAKGVYENLVHKENFSKTINVCANALSILVIVTICATALIGTSWMQNISDNAVKFVGIGSGGSGNAGQDSGSVFSLSVGEEQEGRDFWANKYNALAVFTGWVFNNTPGKTQGAILVPGLVFIFIAYRLLKKKDDFVTPFALVWITFALYLAFIKLKFTFYLGLPLALAAGITINDTLAFLGERQGFEKKTVAFALGLMFLVGVAAGTFFVNDNVPQIEANNGWKETLFWIKDNTPKDAKFFNWWDEGHWLTFIGERAASTDNRNYILKANRDLALFLLAESEDDAYKIVEEYGADYVILSEDLVGKMGALGLYAYNTTNYNDPRLKQQSTNMDCYRSKDPVSGQTTVRCGQNAIPEQGYNSLPFKRVEEPNQIIDQRSRAFVYRDEDGEGLFILNKAANDTFITKLFFDIENIQHFELVYSNKQVRVFKVK